MHAIIQHHKPNKKLQLLYTLHGHGYGFLAVNFMPIATLLKQAHNKLCHYFSNTEDGQKNQQDGKVFIASCL